MTPEIPDAWLPAARMQRIICHWTAGTHRANVVDREHYHIIIEGDGKLVRGDHSIAANVSTADADGYAAHTRSCNTGSIGVSLACMGGDGVSESPFRPGPWPMTRAQWDAMIAVVAQLCAAYAIPVTPRTVLSHAEVQGTLGIAQAGKWDFTRLAFDLSVVGAKACGDRLRAEVAAAMAGSPVPSRPPSAPADIMALQEALIAAGYDCGPEGADGLWGRKTLAALNAFLRDRGVVQVASKPTPEMVRTYLGMLAAPQAPPIKPPAASPAPSSDSGVTGWGAVALAGAVIAGGAAAFLHFVAGVF